MKFIRINFHPEFRKLRYRLLLMVALSVIISPVVVFSQETENEDENEEEVFELNPFVVDSSMDDRYLSNNSTSATGLDMEIRNLPVPVTVINREYLDDLQADDLDSALRYTAGVYTRSYRSTSSSFGGFSETSSSTIGDINDPFQNVISIRGFNVPNQQRNGFRVGSSVPTWGVVLGGGTDDITRERLEVVRGPQALLYGINVLSGVVNIIPKRPLPEPGGTLSISAGNRDYFRSSFDFWGPILEDNVLNYRVMGSYQQEGDPYEVQFKESDRRNLAVQLEYNPVKWASLLVEYVDSVGESRGIGPQYFTDDGGSLNPFKSNFEWTNPWGERMRFGRDDPTLPTIDPSGTVWYNPLYENPRNAQYYPDGGFQDLGPTFNVSGPDTFREQKERSFLALLVLSPFKNLRAEIGYYHVETEIDTFNLNLHTYTDQAGAGVPVLTIDPPGRRKRNLWLDNPEVTAADAVNDPIGYGIGEAFSWPQRVVAPFRAGGLRIGFPQYVPGFPNNPNSQRNTLKNGLDRKIAAYNWYRVPTDAKTDQIRGRVVYNIESEFLNIPSTHTFIAGYHFIKDDVSFVVGAAGDFDLNYSRENDLADSAFADLVKTDPIQFRNSIFDFEPIRYGGEAVWSGGYRAIVTDGRAQSTPVVDLSVARSGWRDAELWYRGAYAIYTGRFWNDRMTIVAGLRHDSNQVKEKERLVIVSNAGDQRLTDNWVGFSPATYLNDKGTPYFIGYGDQPFEYIDELPEALNERVARDVGALQSVRPNGTVRYNYPESQKFTTGTFGVTAKLTQDLSTYLLYSEGVFPNTGLRDGNDQPIDAELTNNIELGLKYDFFDGKLSGAVSVYRIRRDNATYRWGDAPYPARWAGGELNPGTTFNPNRFSPGNADPETYRDAVPLGNQYRPRTYGLSMAYLQRAFEEAGKDLPIEPRRDSEGNIVYGEDGNIVWNPQSSSFEAYGSSFFTPQNVPYSDNIRDYFYYFNYEQIREGDERLLDEPVNNEDGEVINTVNSIPISEENRAIIRRAFEMALNNEPVRDVDPNSPTFGELVDYGGSGIVWDEFNSSRMNNASIYSNPTTVTFSDETLGVDGQVIFSPSRNYQVIFEFSYQDREVVGRGFNLVDPIAQDTGKNWGTEYDKWVYILGYENFEDPTRPSTFNGNGINGIDLSGVPPVNMTLWNRYDFPDGVFDGLTVGGGVSWESSVKTAVGIGNVSYTGTPGAGSVTPNRYPTPDRPSRYELEAFISYKWQNFLGADWSLQVNVRNLLDDVRDFEQVSYTNPQGGTENRRIEIIYPGRSFRISLTAKF